MNHYFQQLLEWMKQNEKTRVEEQKLIQALFYLRAHYNLAGIVVICQRIFSLIGDHELLEFRDDLNTLKIISTLPYSDQYSHFFSETTDRNKHKLTPLRPYTGDSGICDLLLIQAGLSQNNQSFETVIIWFLEQIFYFQKKVHTLELYQRYLHGDGSLKLKDQKGSRVYNAFLAIRLLGDPNYENILEQVKALLIQNLPKQLIQLMSAGSEDKELHEVFYALKLFLSQIWQNNRLKNKKKRREFLHRIGLKHKKLILQRYGSLSIALQPLEDVDEIHRGLVSDVFEFDEIEDDERVLGHLHESTTLKHYIHILFMATYAYSMQQRQPNLHTAFLKRVMSRSTLFRYFQTIQQKNGHLQYELRDTIEKHVFKKRQSQSWVIYAQKIVNSTGKVVKHELFQKFEDIERYFISGQGQPQFDIEPWKSALMTMTNIPSGKRGSHVGRHLLSRQGKLAHLPELLSIVDFNVAQKILEQFDFLEKNQSATYHWLIKKWLYESNVTKVWMHFTLEDAPMLSVLTEHQFFPKRMKHNKYDYFRIMYQQASLSAVRWVLTWLSLRYLVIKDLITA